MNSDLTAVPPYNIQIAIHWLAKSQRSLAFWQVAMVPSQNHTYTLGSPPPTLVCPFCPRRFNTKSGRTRHMEQKHPHDRPDTAAHTSPTPQPSLHNSSPTRSHFLPSLHNPSPVPSHFMPSLHNPSPVPSHFTPSLHNPSPIPSPHFMQSPPPSCDEVNADPNIDMDVEHPRPDSSRLTRVFHPKLNGMSIYFLHIHYQ